MSNLVDSTDKEIERIGQTVINVVDSKWVYGSNNIISNASDKVKNATEIFRQKTYADITYFDTSVGGAYAYGGEWQFSEYCDPRSKGVISNRSESKYGGTNPDTGVGIYYQEAYGRNQQTLVIEAGVPEFASLLAYFLYAGDRRDVIVNRTGREPYELAMSLGSKVGIGYAFKLMPAITTITWGIKWLSKFVAGDPVISYYTLKPTMHHYWRLVSDVANTLALELGVLSLKEPVSNAGSDRSAIPLQINENSIAQAVKWLPDMIGSDGYINVFSIFTKGQRLAEARLASIKANAEKGKTIGSMQLKENTYLETSLTATGKEAMNSLDEFTDKLNKMGGESYGYIKEVVEKVVAESAASVDNISKSLGGLFSGVTGDIGSAISGISSVVETGKSLYETGKSTVAAATDVYKDVAGKVDKTITAALPQNEQDIIDLQNSSIITYYQHIRNYGARHVAVAVEYLGSQELTITNTTTEIPTQSMLRGFASTAKDIRFSLAGGNIFGNAVKQITSAISDFVSAGVAGVSLGLSNVVETLMGGGLVHMPEMWDTTSAELTTYSFKITLPAVYGNKFSLYRDVYMGIALILPLAAPRAIGKSSLGSPFIVSAHLPGFVDIKKGIVTRLNIKKGIGEVPYNDENQSLGIEIEMQITDVDKLFALSLGKGGVKNIVLDDNSMMARYIKMLAGSNVYETNYWLPRARMRMAAEVSDFSIYNTAAFWKSLMSHHMPVIGVDMFNRTMHNSSNRYTTQ